MTTLLVNLPWRLMVLCFGSRYRLMISMSLIILTLITGSNQAYGYWSSPSFCRSCHTMEPHYESWEASPHREIPCMQCHLGERFDGELHSKWVAIKQLTSAVTGAYSSMPYAKVSDSSCLASDCHASMDSEAPLGFTDLKIGFKHGVHMEEMPRRIKLVCTSCHFQRLANVHMEVDKSTCFLCHFKEVEVAGRDIGGCDVCHGQAAEGSMASSYDVDHAEYAKRGMACDQCHVLEQTQMGLVGKERCLSCHNRSENLNRLDDPDLLHFEHVAKRKLHCYQCHRMIEHRFHTREAFSSQQDCHGCHQDSHSPQALLYAGSGAKGVDNLPDQMHTLGLDCAGCHRVPTDKAPGGADQVASTLSPKRACSKCHEDRYDEFVDAVGENLNEMLTYLEKRLQAVQKKVESGRAAGEAPSQEIQDGVATAALNVSFLKRARAIHNPQYAIQILRVSSESLYDLEDELEISDEEDDPPLGFELEDCDVCHDALPEPGELMLSGNRKFPHPRHVEETGLGCEGCHQGEEHPPKVSTAESACRSCHKAEDKDKKEGGEEKKD